MVPKIAARLGDSHQTYITFWKHRHYPFSRMRLRLNGYHVHLRRLRKSRRRGGKNTVMIVEFVKELLNYLMLFRSCSIIRLKHYDFIATSAQLTRCHVQDCNRGHVIPRPGYLWPRGKITQHRTNLFLPSL